MREARWLASGPGDLRGRPTTVASSDGEGEDAVIAPRGARQRPSPSRELSEIERPTDGWRTKVDVTVQSTGRLLGIETRNSVTYCAGIRPDGSLYGEAQGLVMGHDGERATFKAQGVGKLHDGGAVSYRGASYYYSDSTKLSRLNVVATVFEYEADADWNTTSKLWEWK
jgi:hypothetical protein